MNGLTIAIFLMIGFCAAGIWMTFRALALQRRAARTLDWPTVEGEILNAALDRAGDEDGPCRAAATYAYEVEGQRYTGDRLAFGHLESGDEARERAIVEALPPGTRVAVRYDPRNPAVSCLAGGGALIGGWAAGAALLTGVSLGLLLIFGAEHAAALAGPKDLIARILTP